MVVVMAHKEKGKRLFMIGIEMSKGTKELGYCL
jgi:hypothetical protein